MASRVQEGGGGMGSSGSRPRKPIVGIFAPLKMKIVNKNIKSSGGNVKIVPQPTTIQDKLRNQALRSRFDYREPVKNQMMDIENSMARARNAGEIKPKVIKINSK